MKKEITEAEMEDMKEFTKILVKEINDYPSLVIINNVAMALKARHELEQEQKQENK